MVHSLSGVMPVGLFMLVQLWMHATALAGPHAYHDTMIRLSRLPAIMVWQVLALVSLAFHAIYGIVLSARPRYNIGRYPHSGNWLFTLQRVTALVVLGFILLHGALVWVPAQLGWLTARDLYPTMVRGMSSTWSGVPWLSVAYLIGIGACAYHLAAGLWTLGIRWGLTTSRSARAWSGALSAVVGVVVFALGANTILFLATGWPVVGPDRAADDTTTCDAPAAMESASPR